MVPRVTMKGTTRSRVMRMPLASPQAAAAATPPSADRSGLTSRLSNSAMTTVLSAMIEPTERSMPAATMTMVMPRAAVQTIAVCRAMSSRLTGRKNCGPMSSANTAQTKRRPSSGPPRVSRSRVFTPRPRCRWPPS